MPDGAGGVAQRITIARKPVETARSLANHRPIEPVCERIYRDWLRGISERSLSATYGFRRHTIEEILRTQAQVADRRRSA